MDSQPSIIRLEDAYKGYDVGGSRIEILKGIDLTAYAGQSIGIMGPSGSGKSTLLHVLGLLTPLDTGTVSINGRVITQQRDWWNLELRSNFGFVFQDAKLIPKMTVLENVCLPLAHRGVWPKQQKQLAWEVLKRVKLEARLRHHPSQLSGGELVRVAIARALVFQPQVILADEPTGNLDSKTGLKVADLLFEMVSESCVLVIMTHHKPLAERADRLLFITDGRIESRP